MFTDLTPIGSIDETMTLTSLGVDLDRAEFALTSSVTILTQAVLLLCGGILLRRHNATVLIENQLTLDKTTGSLVGRSVPYLGARPLQHLILLSVNVVKTILTAI